MSEYTYRPDGTLELRDEAAHHLSAALAALAEWRDQFAGDHPMHARLQEIAYDLVRHERIVENVCQGCAKLPDPRGECECAFD